MAPRLLPLALACLLLAGCGGVVDQSPAAETGTSPGAAGTPTDAGPTPGGMDTGPDIEVRGALPVDAGRAFGRVTDLTEADVAPRPVVVGNRSGWEVSREPSPLDRALGFESRRLDTGKPVGYTPLDGPVRLDPGTASPERVERVLVHEFVHVVQFETGMLPWAGSTEAVTTDRRKVRLALREGGVVYVTDVYTHRYLDVRNESAVVAARRQRSPTARSALAPYYLGHRYVAGRIDDPAALPTLYADPPRTTEQLIHNRSRAAEPPRPLTVTLDAGGSEWDRTATDTVGELTTRNALATALSPERAATAAAGWGTDRLLAFEGPAGDRGWVWVHRWDTRTDASEARAALRDYAAARDRDTALTVRARPVGERATALVLGPRSFVGNSTVAGSGADVTVAVGA